jgi:hypothetical protein
MEDIERIATQAQEALDKENAQNPIVKNALAIVEEFIKTKRVMCYGGTAINNLLPKEDQFYDKDKDIPDYDFFSETPQLHGKILADKLFKAGYKSVEVKAGVHLGTFKVFADYIGVADISHLAKPIFEKLWKSSIVRSDIHYVDPNFLRMSMYLELSRPRGDVSRWKKVYTRLGLLNKHYPTSCQQSPTASNEGADIPDSIEEKIEDIIIADKCILLGFNAAILQPRSRHGDAGWNFPLDLLVVPENELEVVEKIKKVIPDTISKSYTAYEELLPAHTDILHGNDLMVRIYITSACHSYHAVAADAGAVLRIASIPTLLQFFLASLYAPRHFLQSQTEERFLCVAHHLIELANNSRKRRYKLLTPISCLGIQKSLVDMKKERSELYAKLSKNKSSDEFKEKFYSYNPSTAHAIAKK